MMDMSNPGLMVSAGLISMVGLGVFMYGKRMEDIKSLGIGLGMMIFPIFVPSVIVMWVIAAACGVGLYYGPR